MDINKASKQTAKARCGEKEEKEAALNQAIEVITATKKTNVKIAAQFTVKKKQSFKISFKMEATK